MSGSNWCRIAWQGTAIEIEYQWVGPRTTDRPLMVFLHEGLGSVSLWKGFPAALCDALSCTGLVYSRPGYGQSTPRDPDDPWLPDFLERQACEVLPALLSELGVGQNHPPYWLFGHSDGGSIALIHAARFPGRLGGLVVVAPHVMVEDVSVRSIEAARNAYLMGDLRAGLARHHRDPDSAFWGWNGVWLSAAFRDWSIEHLLPDVVCPVLAIQGTEDPYGTLQQIQRIRDLAPNAELRILAQCGHSPHREQPRELSEWVEVFFADRLSNAQRQRHP